jgi:polysaccharide biosynthesis transport protein
MNTEVNAPDAPEERGRFLERCERYRSLLRRRWWILLTGIIGGALLQLGLLQVGPTGFVSAGRMIVSMKLAIPEGSVYTEELSNFLGTQTALMQSGVVLNRAHARALMQKHARVAQPVSLKVSVLPKTTIFVLQATGVDAEYTQIFLQGCMEEYVALKKEMRLRTSDTTFAGLTDEVLRLEKELRKCDQELAQFQATNGLVQLDEPGAGAGNYPILLKNRLAALKSEHELLASLTLDQNLERQQAGGGVLQLANDPAERSGVAGDHLGSDYLRARQQILLLKDDQQDLAKYLRPKHPKMVALNQEIERRERVLEIFRTQSAEQLKTRKDSLAVEVGNLELEVQQWDAKASEVSRKSAEYQRLRANGQRIQALYDRLLGTMQTLDVNKEISPESVTILEKAGPAVPEQPPLIKKLAVGALLGAGCAILLLLFVDRLDDRLNSFTELQEQFEETVLGQIPRETADHLADRTGRMDSEQAGHALVEAYRNLRSSLLFLADSGQRPKTLAITSSVPGEGKSLSSLNLAIALANSGARVLLVDADLRKGILHQRFGLAPDPGLAEALASGVNWREAVRTTGFGELCFLSRGALNQRSGELFISAAIKKFLAETGAAYDWVILDTPPVMAVDDVTSLAPQLDGVLFVMRAEYTSARVAHAALDLLYQRQVRVLGLVFNAVQPGSSGSFAYHEYNDYYRPRERRDSRTAAENFRVS